MSHNLYAASAQYAKRPNDERFQDLSSLIQSAKADRAACVRSVTPAENVRAIVGPEHSVMLAGKNREAALTNWSFGQLAQVASAPAAYLRTLPPQLAADCINHGLIRLTEEQRRENHALLMRNAQDGAPFTVRAITSEKYSRVWDHTVAEHVQRITNGGSWELPMTWAGVRAGAYRGDRDMFLFMTNGGSIVNDPTLTGGSGQMFRGFIVRNSEVGAAALSVQTFMFRFVCGNHIIWHAENVVKTSRRHVGKMTAEDGEAMISRAMRAIDASARNDEQQIAKLAATPYAKDKDAIVTQARKDGMTEKDARAAFDAAERNEPNPTSVWGFVQGITRHSQTRANQDDRNELDQLAGAILHRARLAVAA